jgi:Ca-activated chloride channel family protein
VPGRFGFVLLLAGSLAMPALARAQAQNPTKTPGESAGQARQGGQPKQPPAPGSVVRREVHLVNVVFAVSDRRNRFATDLDQKDFRVFEDGRGQRIEFFHRETDLPLRIGVLLDTSNSIRSRLKFEKEAAFNFLFDVLRREKDLAFIETFDSGPEIQQDYTNDIEKLRSAINRQRAGGGTALYDAIVQACASRLLHPPPGPADNPEVRRVLVVVSDGVDDLSNHTLADALEMAERAGVAVYAISTSTDWVALDQPTEEGIPRKLHLTGGDKILHRLAEDTGGRAFYPYRVDDLARSFQAIGTELRSQYSLAYTPTGHAADNKFHRIEVKVDRKGLIVHARKGYYAEGAPAAAPPASPGG